MAEKKKKTGDVPFDDVQALIRREEEAAVAVFRESDFDRRVKEQIRADSPSRKRVPRLLPFPFPSPIHAIAAVLLVLLIAVPAVVYLVTPSAAPFDTDKEFRELRDYFTQALTPRETSDEEASPAPAAVSPEYAALEENFTRALYAAYIRHQDLTADNLPRIFDKVLFNVPLPGEEDITTVTDPRRLEERIKTMIEEKQVYRTLSRVAQKT
jgi:hypothetical protein